MDPSTSQDRNQPASARKLKNAREQGQVARSRDLGHFAALGSGALGLALALPSVISYLRHSVATQLHFDAGSLREPGRMLEALSVASQQGLLMVLPLALLVMAAAVAAAMVTGGWTFSLQAVKPSLSKLNPLSGIARLLSRQQWLETVKLLLLAALLCGVTWMYLSSHLADLAQGLGVALPQALQDNGNTLRAGLLLLLLVLGLVAALDLPLQRWQHRDKLKMSQQELKQENKENNGDPQIKARVRRRQREIASRRMMAAVPKADLVVMNPTHYAVALRYDEAHMRAPQVVAKGADLLALRMRALAQSSQVPVLTSPRLARALYAHAELDQEIPTALYSAVAQVLAYVYQLRAALKHGVAAPAQVPDPQVPPELDPHSAHPTQPSA